MIFVEMWKIVLRDFLKAHPIYNRLLRISIKISALVTRIPTQNDCFTVSLSSFSMINEPRFRCRLDVIRHFRTSQMRDDLSPKAAEIKVFLSSRYFFAKWM